MHRTSMASSTSHARWCVLCRQHRWLHFRLEPAFVFVLHDVFVYCTVRVRPRVLCLLGGASFVVNTSDYISDLSPRLFLQYLVCLYIALYECGLEYFVCSAVRPLSSTRVTAFQTWPRVCFCTFWCVCILYCTSVPSSTSLARWCVFRASLFKSSRSRQVSDEYT